MSQRSARSTLLPATLAALLVSAAATALAEDPVLVSVTGPLVGKVGERVSFEVELVNRSGKPLQQLRVIDYFDAGFHHDASKSPIEQKGTIDLAPGTARRLTLDFLLDEPGRQCHRVEILDQSHVFVGGATHCVEVTPALAVAPRQAPGTAPPSATTGPPLAVPVPVPPATLVPAPAAGTTVTVPAAAALELDLVGPVETASGGVVECLATVKNTGAVASGPTSLQFSWDDLLTPLEASDGYSLVASRVSWNLPAIEPGGQMKRQINLRAQSPANAFRDSPPGRTCIRGVLNGLAGGAMVADEVCVLVTSTTPRPRIRSPSEAGLRLSLADLDDPVRVGGATTLVCTVSNGGTAASGRLDLVLVLPDQARIVGDPSPARVRVEDARVSFESIQGIPPGGQQTFEITYRLPTGGIGKATAILTGAELDGSLERGCQTTFLEP